MLTSRSPILPPRLFKVGHLCHVKAHTTAQVSVQTRTTGIVLITCFIHAVTFFAGIHLSNLDFRMLILPFLRRFLPPTLFSSPWIVCNRRWSQVRAIPDALAASAQLSALLRMIPFSLGASITSVISGVLCTRTGKYRPIIWFAYATMVLGWGLMTTLDDHSDT